ncbi:MAG: [FeFe] hydrogenase H-cluster maturation GTPase HydF [Ruminococcaceae bacterium]|nr:[FeFe] hydrogenase H-cluster maturation GTPase HydF [Oscillospiraceae bacterium]
MLKQETPLANRKHIGIFGNTNAGKSTLFNQIIGQELAIVSEEQGTTTDPVIKGMELISYGPIALIDTAGLGDVSVLGDKRIEKTKQMLDRCDYIIYAVDSQNALGKDIIIPTNLFGKIPYTIVFTKTDLLSGFEVESLKNKFPNAQFANYKDEKSIQRLKHFLTEELRKIGDEDDNQLIGLVSSGDFVVMVVPIDSAAPKGRLILPQVAFLRNCLDLGVTCTVTKEETLKETISNLPRVDLVVTDSQVFKSVAEMVPKTIPLTSFSMLLARQKGDLKIMLSACDIIPNLQDGDKILMLEACTHNHTHEDIGRVKIPALLQKFTGVSLEFEYYVGYDFPSDLSPYKLAIHCGGCMITKKTVLTRLEKCKNAGLPITNYGVVLAYLSGISDRCSEVFFSE